MNFYENMYSIDSDNNLMSSALPWSRDEDKTFEKALVDFPEGMDDRWYRIAEYFPGRSPFEVHEHYQILVYDIGEIDSGRIVLPSYSDDSGWENEESRMPGQISFGAPRNRSRHSDGERKKGTPWTEEEHRKFLEGLAKYGKGDWRSISRNVVVSRTPTQVASHAQKYFLRQHSVKKERKRSSIHDITGDSFIVPAPASTNLPSQVQGGLPDYHFAIPQ